MSVLNSVPPGLPVGHLVPGTVLDPESMIAVDFDPDGLRISPCRCCAEVWWAELVLVDRRVQLREWHRPGCPDWGDVVVHATSPAVPVTSRDTVVRGAGLRGLLTTDPDRGRS